MQQLAKWFRTGHTSRLLGSCIQLASVFALILGVNSCASQKPQPGRDAAFQQINADLNLGNYDKALQSSKEAWLNAPTLEWGWRFKLQHVLSLLYVGKVDRAGELLKPELPPTLSVLRPRYQYLRAYLRLRQHDPSSPDLVRSVIQLAHAAGDANTEADGLLLLLRCSQYTVVDTRKIALQALHVARENHLIFQEVNSLSELGLLSVDRHQYTEAIPYFVQTAALANRIRAHYFQVNSLSNLGECYFSLGDLDRALRSLAAARSVLRPSDPTSLRIAVSNELGSLYSLRQQNQEAVQHFREAFDIAAADPGLSGYAPSALNLAQSLVEAHSWDDARKYNDLAAEALKLHRVPDAGLLALNELNRADIAAAAGNLIAAQQSYRKVLELLKTEPSNSTQWSAHAKLAVVEEHLGQTAEARKNFEQALTAIESNRSEQRITDFQITFLSTLIRFYQQYVAFLIRQNQPWVALAVADSSRASVLSQGQISSRALPDFSARIHQRAHASGSVLLFYWLAPEASYVWAIAPGGVLFQTLPAEADIERDVKSYSAFIEGERQDTLAAGNPIGMRLYQTLIGCLNLHLATGTKVIVVPDGALHGLNFETLLVNGGNPHYWLQDVSVTVVPSLAILLQKAKTEVHSGGALIMGDPVYTGTDYPPLPESGHEVTQVSARFPKGSKVLTNKQAVRSAYASSQPGLFSLIHFSAHVDADAQSPLDSAIILSPGEGGSRLYARDVMNIPLHANLVTISGCRSVGAKALSGEGMVGFAWAAFQAGARNAVTSLWAVDDRSTADLMDRFYGGVTAGKPYASALREAKLQMLQSAYKKPYYWAPFQLYSRDIGQR